MRMHICAYTCMGSSTARLTCTASASAYTPWKSARRNVVSSGSSTHSGLFERSTATMLALLEKATARSRPDCVSRPVFERSSSVIETLYLQGRMGRVRPREGRKGESKGG